jgi:transcriptional antiterminator RfaH
MQWYALRCKSNREHVVAAAVQGKEYEVFLPSVEHRAGSARAARTPLFAGYVFARFDPHRRLPILTTPGVVHIVSSGGFPLPIDAEEIESLRIATGSSLVMARHEYVSAGQEVVVRRGPLSGARGIVVHTDHGQRLIVSISILQRSVAVELFSEWVEPAERVA